MAKKLILYISTYINLVATRLFFVKSVAIILTTLEFNSSKIGASAVVVKTTVAKENEPRSRSFCAKSFNGVLIVQPPLHIDRGTHGIVDHRPSNSLVKRFLCIPSTSRSFPLTSILSPIPYRGIIEKRSIL